MYHSGGLWPPELGPPRPIVKAEAGMGLDMLMVKAAIFNKRFFGRVRLR
jgi:hypothetical protein